MQTIRYIVKDEGKGRRRYTVYKQTVYDSGQVRSEFVDTFVTRVYADKVAEELNLKFEY